MFRPSLLPVVLGATLLAGCADDRYDHLRSTDPYHPRVDAACAATDAYPLRSSIDTDARLTAALPGEETGVFIEYWEDAAGGIWEVTATCDTAVSAYACLWDVYARPEWGSVQYEPYELDDEDYLDWYGNDAEVALYSDTAYGVDGFTLYTDPGAPVTFEVYLDDCSGARYVYWVGDGAAHAGSPTNPIVLAPAY